MQRLQKKKVNEYNIAEFVKRPDFDDKLKNDNKKVISSKKTCWGWKETKWTISSTFISKRV